MSDTGREEGDGQGPAAGPPPRPWGRLLVAGAIGAALVLTGIAADVLLAGGNGAEDDNAKERSAGHRPVRAKPAPPEPPAVRRAAEAAGCELRSLKVASRDHVNGPVRYRSRPPAGGDHSAIPAEDGIYSRAAPIGALVHSLEHGRVVIWFKPGLAAGVRRRLKAFYDGDPSLLLLTPDGSGMSYEIAASAWSRDPEPDGTGRVLGCPRAGTRTFGALAAFRDEHRGHGPEDVP